MSKPHALRKIREERLITQRELASASGVSRRTIISIETRRSNPRYAAREALLKALRIPLDQHIKIFGRPRT